MRSLPLIGLIVCLTYGCLLRSQDETSNPKSSPSAVSVIQQIDQYIALSESLRSNRPDSAMVLARAGLALAKSNGAVEAEARLLLQMGIIESIRSDYTESDRHLNDALALFQRLKDMTAIATIWNAQGVNRQRLGAYEEALDRFARAELIYGSIQDTSGLCKIYLNRGNVYLAQGDLESASAAYATTVEWSLATGHDRHLAAARLNRAMVLRKMGDLPSALSLSFETLKAHLDRGNDLNVARALRTIGITLTKVELYVDALAFHEKALKYAQRSNNRDLLAATYQAMGNTLKHLERFDEALQNLQSSLDLFHAIDSKKTGSVLTAIGATYLEMKDWPKSESYLSQAVAKSRQADEQYNLALCHVYLGKLYSQTSDIAASEEHLQTALEMLEARQGTAALVDVFNHLAVLHEKQRNFEDALAYKKRAESIEDSLFSAEELNEVHRVLIREDLQRQSDVMASLQADLDARSEYLATTEQALQTARTHRYYLIGLSVFVIGFLLFTIFRLRRRQQNNRRKMQQLQQARRSMNAEMIGKNREIATLSLDLVQREEFIQQLRTRIEKLTQKEPSKKELLTLLNLVKIDDLSHDNWKRFQAIFVHIFPTFFEQLREKYPHLSNRDLRLCGLIRMGISPIECAAILGISKESVHAARHRIRKKMHIFRHEDLDQHLAQF